MHWFALAWPIVTFVYTAAFKARTPEEYDEMIAAGWPQWFMKLTRFVAAIGVDGSTLGGLLKDLSSKTSKTATEEYISKLPADIRATLPPLTAPQRIDSKEIPAVRPLNVGDYLGGTDER